MEERQEADDLTRLLPDDMLAEVLSRAAPRGLAAARCVCRSWRALIDGRRMLRADLLPRSLAGLFIDQAGKPYSTFYARPSTNIAGYHLPRSSVLDHCNGLILERDGVLNPATGGWTPLPEPPPSCMFGITWSHQSMYLAFDPTISSHYEVLVIPNASTWSDRQRCNELPAEEYTRSSQWPPSPWKLNVFSSKAGRWDERCFGRQNDEAAGTAIAEMLEDMTGVHRRRKAVCWRGAIYVQCQLNFVMRISLSDDKYRAIEPPMDLHMSKHEDLYLEKSEKGGVYFALLANIDHSFRVWTLDESTKQTRWILKHDSGCGLAVPRRNLNRQVYRPWILERYYRDDQGNIEEAHEIEWDSDDDDGEDILQSDECRTGRKRRYPMLDEILAFHPFKEIVFLHRSRSRGLFAYNFSSSKLEELGKLWRPKHDYVTYGELGYVQCAVPYTPCLMGEFSEKLKLSDDDS